MGIPVVIAENGFGLPVVDATAGGLGLPMTVAASGYGTPVTLATNGYGIAAVFDPPLGPAVIPSNTLPPYIDDANPTVPELINVTQGSWANSPTSFSYEWFRRT